MIWFLATTLLLLGPLFAREESREWLVDVANRFFDDCHRIRLTLATLFQPGYGGDVHDRELDGIGDGRDESSWGSWT